MLLKSIYNRGKDGSGSNQRETHNLATKVETAQRAAEAAGQGNAELAIRVTGQVRPDQAKNTESESSQQLWQLIQ